MSLKKLTMLVEVEVTVEGDVPPMQELRQKLATQVASRVIGRRQLGLNLHASATVSGVKTTERGH